MVTETERGTLKYNLCAVGGEEASLSLRSKGSISWLFFYLGPKILI
jgi:hypothetical protein